MSAVCLIDTSIFCNLLDVPGRAQRKEQILDELEAKLWAGETMLLPITAIIETGNHIAHHHDGRQRRIAAQRFSAEVRKAINGDNPFTPTPMYRPEVIGDWLVDFPDWVAHSSGFGDLTIKKEWDRQCELHRLRRVYIWSLDAHLDSYNRSPSVGE